MKREAVKKLIKESKQYLLTATTEQKARYLELLERAYKNMESDHEQIVEHDTVDFLERPENPDFLEEK